MSLELARKAARVDVSDPQWAIVRVDPRRFGAPSPIVLSGKQQRMKRTVT